MILAVSSGTRGFALALALLVATVVGIGAEPVPAGATSQPDGRSRTGKVTGTIQVWPPPMLGPAPRGRPGVVSIFQTDGQFVARRRLHAGQRFMFTLAAGRYLITTRLELRYSRSGAACNPRPLRIMAAHTETLTVFVNCRVGKPGSHLWPVN